jgi:hypothetical protein
MLMNGKEKKNGLSQRRIRIKKKKKEKSVGPRGQAEPWPGKGQGPGPTRFDSYRVLFFFFCFFSH